MKDILRDYLQTARDAVVWKLDGLTAYDARRPLVPTGTNLLGLVKHLAGCELGYFGPVFGRSMGPPVVVRRRRRGGRRRRHVRPGGRVTRRHHCDLPPGVGAR